MLRRAISNRNVLTARFRAVPFADEWLASLGRPELRGSWLVWGGSGSGKTTFMLQLCRYLSRFGRVAYDSLEQGLSLSFQTAWKRTGMSEAGSRVILLDKEPVSDLRERLRRRKSPDVVVIDSVMCLVGFTRREYLSLVGEFPDKLFVFAAHESNRRPDPAIAETIRRLSDIKIRVEGYVAYPTTRYEVPELGEGGAPYVIWREGAAQYRARLEGEEIEPRRLSGPAFAAAPAAPKPQAPASVSAAAPPASGLSVPSSASAAPAPYTRPASSPALPGLTASASACSPALPGLTVPAFASASAAPAPYTHSAAAPAGPKPKAGDFFSAASPSVRQLSGSVASEPPSAHCGRPLRVMAPPPARASRSRSNPPETVK